MAKRTYRLSPAELAVLTHYASGGAVALDEAALAELRTSPEQLRLSEENLMERGLLLRSPAEEAPTVADPFATVLRTTLAPDIVCVLRTQRKNDPGPVMYFSFTAEAIARNFVDAQGQHLFTELADVDEVLDEMLASSGVQAQQSPRQNGATQSLQTLLPDCETLTLLMVVVEPAQPQPDVQNLSWLVARGGVWLIDAAAEPRNPSAHPADWASVRQAITRALAPHTTYQA